MVKYFLAVRVCPSHALAVLVVITLFALVTVWLNPQELDSGLGLLLFAQMFLASSGFAIRARRGHFDPLLVHGTDRVATLAAHWCASIAPGLSAWVIVSLAGLCLGSPAAGSALAGVRMVALLMVSAVAWSAGFLLPRGAAGAMWVGMLVAFLIRHADLLPAMTTPGKAVTILRHGATLLACPFLLIGAPSRVTMPDVTVAACFAFAVLLCTWRLGSRLDIYLVDRS